MKRPSGNRSRKITDTNQVYLDTINPPVLPDVGRTSIQKMAPGKYAEKTTRAGRD
jgi:hypothetical protein